MKGYPSYGSAGEYLERVRKLLDRLAEPTERLAERLFDAFESGRSVFLAGNGGSAANASHFGHDLAKGTTPSLEAARRFRVVPLTDNVPWITALANDAGFDRIFEQQLRNLARPGDLLVAFSGSGNSPNVIRAVEYAREIGIEVLALTGFDGGRLLPLADLAVHVPVDDMGMCEALHGVVFHCAISELRARIARLPAA